MYFSDVKKDWRNWFHWKAKIDIMAVGTPFGKVAVPKKWTSSNETHFGREGHILTTRSCSFYLSTSKNCFASQVCLCIPSSNVKHMYMCEKSCLASVHNCIYELCPKIVWDSFPVPQSWRYWSSTGFLKYLKIHLFCEIVIAVAHWLSLTFHFLSYHSVFLHVMFFHCLHCIATRLSLCVWPGRDER